MTPFHLIFQHLKQLNIYDPDHPVDQFVLGFVYLPLIRRSLSKFIRMWNHHKLRTEGYKSPLQLYTTWIQLHTESMIDIRHLHDRFQDYGLDWECHGPNREATFNVS